MSSEERYRQIDALLETALDLEVDRRASFLDKACAGDVELRQEIEGLLQAHERAAGFMRVPALEIAARTAADDNTPDLVGRRLGPYPVLAFLASGGMGDVYRARDPRLDREVAIKVLPPLLAQDTEAVSRFEREAKAVAALSHPNVLAIHDFGRDQGVCYAVTELLEGETLRDRLERKRLSAQEALDIALGVVGGLAAAHGKGIIHRDLKPENIFLTDDGAAKILDFGLARFKDRTPEGSSRYSAPARRLLTHAGTVLGTSGYMSPEQVRGDPADAPSDVFSFGCVLYEMLTGLRAFARASAAETAAAILRDSPPTLVGAGVNGAPALEQLLHRCLEKRPEDRYDSAEALLAALKAVQENPRVSRVRFPMWRWVALGVGAAILAGWAILALVPRGAERPSPTGFRERDWIVIAEFENQTGERIFDKSLDTALRISVAQSSYVNVLSPSHIADALHRMRKDAKLPVDRSVGREIAQREGAKLLLVPAIAGFAGSYMLSSSIEDPLSGNTLVSQVVRVQRKEEVLDGIDLLVRKSRRDLGESLDAISRQSRSLVHVTTSSLEALKQYSLGIEKHRDVKLMEARSYYENALALDPGFTAAVASLGMIQYEHFDREAGKKLLAQAVRDVEGLTERERYRILAFYARAVENDLPKGIRYLESFLALYPDDGVGHHNLGWFNAQVGRYEEAINHYKEAIRIDPSLMYSYDNLNRLYLYQLGRPSLAIDLCRKQLERDPQRLSAYDNLGWAYLGAGKLELARIAFEKAVEIDPKAAWDLYRLAHTLRLQKNYAKALETLRRIPDADPKESIDYDLAVVYQLMGDKGNARRHFELSRSKGLKDLSASPGNPVNRISLACVKARLGLIDKNDFPELHQSRDPAVHFVLANYYSLRNQNAKAMAEVEWLVRSGWGNYIWLKVHPDMDNLSRDDRFKALLGRVLK